MILLKYNMFGSRYIAIHRLHLRIPAKNKLCKEIKTNEKFVKLC